MGIDATITLKFIFKDEHLPTANRLYEILSNSILLNENKNKKDYIKFEEHKHENELLPPRTYHEITVYKHDDWNFWLERWGLMSIISGLEKYAEGSINNWWDKGFIIVSSIFGCAIEYKSWSMCGSPPREERWICSFEHNECFHEENQIDEDGNSSNLDYDKKDVYNLI